MSQAVEYFLLVEFTKNPDGYRDSNYMYKDRGGLLMFGPPWVSGSSISCVHCRPGPQEVPHAPSNHHSLLSSTHIASRAKMRSLSLTSLVHRTTTRRSASAAGTRSTGGSATARATACRAARPSARTAGGSTSARSRSDAKPIHWTASRPTSGACGSVGHGVQLACCRGPRVA